MQYRKEIDGLRALAVIPVILFHAGIDVFQGGFVGVDVFFVISGYLITSIILAEQRAGTFSLIGFYERRARRILPALFFVMIVCLPFAWVWMFPRELSAFADSLIAVSMFASNILFFSESDYFAPAADLKPLLHTWSLAVEEQFYLAFPLVMILLWRFAMKWLVAVVSVAALLSLAYAQLGANLNFSAPYIEPEIEWFAQPTLADFYLPIGRAWELMLGTLAALWLSRSTPAEDWFAHWAAGLGGGLVLYSIFAFDSALPFPSVYTLIPTVGTVLIILYATPGTLVGRVLSLRAFVSIGLISYSAYLWHQPLFAFARLRSLNDPGPVMYLGLSAATLVLAFFSWRYVERPFRDRKAVPRKTVFGGALALTLAMIGVGLLGHVSGGFEARISTEVQDLLAYREDKVPSRHCATGVKGAKVERCILGADEEPFVAIVGDSHASQLAYAFDQTAVEHGLSANVLIRAGCMPVPGLFRLDDRSEKQCRRFNDNVFATLAARPELTHVVVAARWALYLEQYPFDNGEGGVERSYPRPVAPVGTEAWRRGEEYRRQLVAAQYVQGIQGLLALGKVVILVYPIPEVGWDVPTVLARASAHGIERTGPMSTSQARFEQRNAAVHRALDAVGEHPNLTRIKPAQRLCDTVVADRCVAELNGVPIYYDDNHLNSIGAAVVLNDVLAGIDLPGSRASAEILSLMNIRMTER